MSLSETRVSSSTQLVRKDPESPSHMGRTANWTCTRKCLPPQEASETKGSASSKVSELRCRINNRGKRYSIAFPELSLFFPKVGRIMGVTKTIGFKSADTGPSWSRTGSPVASLGFLGTSTWRTGRAWLSQEQGAVGGEDEAMKITSLLLNSKGTCAQDSCGARIEWGASPGVCPALTPSGSSLSSSACAQNTALGLTTSGGCKNLFNEQMKWQENEWGPQSWAELYLPRGACLTHLIWLELPVGNHLREHSLSTCAKKPRRMCQHLLATVSSSDSHSTWWFLSAYLAMKPSGWELPVSCWKPGQGQRNLCHLVSRSFPQRRHHRASRHPPSSDTSDVPSGPVFPSLSGFQRPIYTLPFFPQ